MRKLLLTTFILFLNLSTFGQPLTCKDFKNGVFQFEGINGGYYTVIRNDSTQYEQNTKIAQHSIMKIKWSAECNYTLFDRTEYKWGKEPTKDQDIAELKNTIFKIESPNKFYVKTYLEGYTDTIETIFHKIDTTKYYNNIFQLEDFKEYKNSKSYGQTLLGEIFSIEYYQSNLEEKKYIIIFETTFQTEKYNKSTLLDSKILRIENDENITNSNCRYNDEYDDEILAVYKSENENEEAKIIMAFRFNRKTKLIEEIDKSKVKYKVSDRMRIKW